MSSAFRQFWPVCEKALTAQGRGDSDLRVWSARLLCAHREPWAPTVSKFLFASLWGTVNFTSKYYDSSFHASLLQIVDVIQLWTSEHTAAVQLFGQNNSKVNHCITVIGYTHSMPSPKAAYSFVSQAVYPQALFPPTKVRLGNPCSSFSWGLVYLHSDPSF